MNRPCLDCGTPSSGTRCLRCTATWMSRRNAQPARSIYGGGWPAESRAIRAAQPWCSECGTPIDLTVDHPTRAVLCRSHHGELEQRRRRAQRG